MRWPGSSQFTPAIGVGQQRASRSACPYYLVPRALSDVSTTLAQLQARRIRRDRDRHEQGRRDRGRRGLLRVGSRGQEGARQGGRTTSAPSACSRSRSTRDRAVDRVRGEHVRPLVERRRVNEFDIFVDVNNDGIDDYVVVGVDQGAVQTGTFNGVMGSFVFSTGAAGASIDFLAQRAARQLDDRCISVLASAAVPGRRAVPERGEPALHVLGGRLRPDRHRRPGRGRRDRRSSTRGRAAISQGGFQTVAPGGTATETITKNAAEWALTPALGIMVVTSTTRQERTRRRPSRSSSTPRPRFDRGAGGDAGPLFPWHRAKLPEGSLRSRCSRRRSVARRVLRCPADADGRSSSSAFSVRPRSSPPRTGTSAPRSTTRSA